MMLKALFSAESLWQNTGLALIRILVGLLMAYHGMEIFKPDVMSQYQTWDEVRSLPDPVFMVYTGKTVEFITGICFVLGLFTRVAAILMAADMLFICFRIGSGKFWYEDQYPFLFALIAIIFFFAGPVRWSLDKMIFKKKIDR
jgi:putative oxidoreductase